MIPQLQRTIALGTLVAGLLGGCTRSNEPSDAAYQTLLRDSQTLKRLKQERDRLQKILDEHKQGGYSPTVLRQPTAEDQQSLEEFLAPSKPAPPGELTLAHLYAGAGECNGFIISRQGHLLTNYHCLNGFTNNFFGLLSTPLGQKTYQADLLAYNETIDIALLQAKPDSNQFTFSVPPQLGSKEAQYGEQLTVHSVVVDKMGFMRLVSMDGTMVDDFEYYTTGTSHLLKHGQSGSPVIDAGGKVAGMAMGIFSPSKKSVLTKNSFSPAMKSLLVSVEAIRKFLGDYLSPKTTPTTNKYSHTESFIYKCPF